MNNAAIISTVLIIAFLAPGMSAWALDSQPPKHEINGSVPVPHVKNNQKNDKDELTANTPNGQLPTGEQKSVPVNTSDVSVTYKLSPEMEKQYPGFFELVKNSDVLDEAEKQYWFDMLPQMTSEQIERLTGLLGKGRDKREGLEEDYRKQLDELNRQHSGK